MTVTKQERGICELYQEDPERADALLFGRRTHADRRGFLRGAGLAAIRARARNGSASNFIVMYLLFN